MLKITIEIKENKDKQSCNVKIINPKDLSKATEGEKNTGAMVHEKITKTLEELQG